MSTRKRDRFFALFGAILFGVTASAFTIAIVWSAIASKHDDPNANKDSSQTSTNDTNKKASNTLAGTQLQNFTPVSDIPELKTEDQVIGTGAEVKPGDTVTVDYTGAIASTGVIFESSKDSGQPISFSLDGVIKGWTEGLPGMKVGGTRRLLIPSDLAYGSQGNSKIPANSDLVFDVTLHKIGK